MELLNEATVTGSTAYNALGLGPLIKTRRVFEFRNNFNNYVFYIVAYDSYICLSSSFLAFHRK